MNSSRFQKSDLSDVLLLQLDAMINSISVINELAFQGNCFPGLPQMDDQKLHTQQEPAQCDAVAKDSGGENQEMLTRSDQKVVAAICLLLLLWASWRWVDLSHWGREEIEIHRQSAVETSYMIDVNSSNWLEFAMLEGIGEVLAKRIIAYRDTQGDFSSVQQLRKVQGIGEKTLEKIRTHLVIRDTVEP